MITATIIQVDDATFLCGQTALIAAPMPDHAPETSCTAVKCCRRAVNANNASRCVMKTSPAVYSYNQERESELSAAFAISSGLTV
jgi:hypothetical protein